MTVSPIDLAGAGRDTDPFDPRRVIGAEGLLAVFNRAGVLAASDVHVAARLCALGGETDEQVALATALAVRGPRFGHVRVDLANAPAECSADLDDHGTDGPPPLPWPDPAGWLESLRSSPLVATAESDPAGRPLRLAGTAVYLDRYWRDEGTAAAELSARSLLTEPAVAEPVLEEGLERLFPSPAGTAHAGAGSHDQRRAAENAVRRRLSVIAGGPGTGKTTTVAKVIALLFDQSEATESRRPLIALTAPTGKAAARMQEAVRVAGGELPLAGSARACLENAEAMTIHRLLRRRPDSSSRFVHDRYNRLPHDVVIVDEMSMVSLPLMARLLEAVRPDARLILVGDPEQLASVEAGAVMADLVTPGPLDEAVTVLRSNYRFSGSLASLSDAVRSGDADRAIETLREPGDNRITWIEAAADEAGGAALAPLRHAVADFGRRLHYASQRGDATDALRALGAFRLLCAHRNGPAGVAAWTEIVESWLAADVDGFSAEPEWYPGRPVMITANDYSLRLFNGDTGAVLARPDGSFTAVFDQGGRAVEVSPSRLASVETVFAMTVHKSQGSEFEQVALVLPPAASRLLTRELLYTALTRARSSLVVVGSEEALRTAVAQRVTRASGLDERLIQARAAGAPDGPVA